MNRFKTFLLLAISFILQTTIFSKIDIYGANVNLFIPAVVALSQVLANKTSAYGSLIVGLLEDFLFTSFVGVRALSYFLISSFVSSSRFKISKDKAAGFMMTFLATVFNFLLVSLIYYIFGTKISLMNYLPAPLLIEAILNSLLYLIFQSIVKKVMYLPTYRI